MFLILASILGILRGGTLIQSVAGFVQFWVAYVKQKIARLHAKYLAGDVICAGCCLPQRRQFPLRWLAVGMFVDFVYSFFPS